MNMLLFSHRLYKIIGGGLSVCCLLAALPAAHAANPAFLGDNNTSSTALTDARGFTEMGNHVYFRAAGPLGIELYRTDGTPNGVELVKDIFAGEQGSEPSAFTVFKNNLYFRASDSKYGHELWKSDGTEAGTVLVKDLTPLRLFTFSADFATTDDALFFAGTEAGNTYRLYKTDGTESGTVTVGEVLTPKVEFETLNNIVYFAGAEGTDGAELWRTDGTAAGTYRVKDIKAGAGTSNVGSLQSLNGALYFVATSDSTDELWRSDGTETGTVRLTAARVDRSVKFAAVGDDIYFSADTAGTGQYSDLWKTDGTVTGTVSVKEFTSGNIGNPYDPSSLVELNGLLLFATEGTQQLWKSDGTAAGTIPIGSISAGLNTDDRIARTASKVYFANGTQETGVELWESDGTASGTKLTQEFMSGPNSSYPRSLTAIGGKIYFTTIAGPVQDQVLVLDSQNSNVTPLTLSGSVASFSVKLNFNNAPYNGAYRIGNLLYYCAWDGEHGWEPWVSDGTPGGTRLLKDIKVGAASSTPSSFTNVNGTCYFMAEDDPGNFHLWKTNGTEAGTVLVKPMYGRHGFFMTASVGEALYIQGRFGGEPRDAGQPITSIREELWRSDGTEAGTYPVGGPAPKLFNGSQSPLPLPTVNDVLIYVDNSSWMWKTDPVSSTTTFLKTSVGQIVTMNVELPSVTLNNLLVFAGTAGPSVQTIYVTDGTDAGTRRLKNSTAPLFTFSNAVLSEPADGRIMFFNRGSENAMWISDGTDSGTTKIAVLTPEPTFFGPISKLELATAGGMFIFRGNDNTNGVEPWVSDGTLAGTQLLKDINPGTAGCDIRQLTSVGDLVYFSAYNVLHGYQLWRTDGTLEGTVMVTNFFPGPASTASFPVHLKTTGNVLTFTADNGINGSELWTIKAPGIEPELTDVEPGPRSSGPANYEALGTRLVFTAYNSTSGADLWAVDVGSAAAVSDWNLY